MSIKIILTSIAHIHCWSFLCTSWCVLLWNGYWSSRNYGSSVVFGKHIHDRFHIMHAAI